MKKLLTLAIFGLLSFSALVAAPVAESPSFYESYSDSLYRRVIIDGSTSMTCHLAYPQGVSAVQENFENNAAELSRLDAFIHKCFADTAIYVSSVQLTGYSSIEGTFKFNENLSKSRVNGFLQYLDHEYELPAKYKINVDWVPEDWDGLRALIVEHDMPYKNDVLSIIDNIGIFQGREKLLMDLKGGAPYKYMYKEYFPLLRRVEIKVEYDLRRILDPEGELTETEFNEKLSETREIATEIDEATAAQDQARLDAVYAQIAATEAARQAEIDAAQQLVQQELRLQATKDSLEVARRTQLEEQNKLITQYRADSVARAKDYARNLRTERRMMTPLIGIKTNLVSWAGITDELESKTFMPNLAVEYFFLDKWSVQANGTYAYFDFDGDKQFWGVSAYGVEPRFWFKGDGLYRWLYIGIYGQAGDFDLRSDELTSDGNPANWTGTYYEGGLSLGCYVPITRNLGFEVGVRGGYRSSKADLYDVDPPHNWQVRDEKDNKFGLTGLNLNISYRFGK